MNQANRDSCLFCQRMHADHSFALILRRALYSKYSQSQNYFYQKEVNDILDDRRLSIVIKFKDFNSEMEENEYMRRFYMYYESTERKPSLLEYYKYHINIPRNFFSVLLSKRNEKNRQIIYRKIKADLGLAEEKVPTSPKIRRETSADCSVKQMKNLLKDLKLESTQPDISRITNSTILKDLVRMIPEPKVKPFQLFNQNKSNKKPQIDMNKLIYTSCQGSLMKTIQNQIKQQLIQPQAQTQIKAPLTARPAQTHSRQSSGQLSAMKLAYKQQSPFKQVKKQPNPLKSRQASQINFDLTKSAQNTTRKYNDALLDLAKKMLQAKMPKKKPSQTQQNNNFFVKGGAKINKNLYIEDLKSSMRSLRSRIQTPSRQCCSNVGSPSQRIK